MELASFHSLAFRRSMGEDVMDVRCAFDNSTAFLDSTRSEPVTISF